MKSVYLVIEKWDDEDAPYWVRGTYENKSDAEKHKNKLFKKFISSYEYADSRDSYDDAKQYFKVKKVKVK